VIIQVTTHYTKFSRTCKHVHSKVTYLLKVHQFMVQQVGKGGKECDRSSYHSLHKIKSYVQTCSFKGNLPTESAPVHSVASGERRNVIGIDQVVTHYLKFNPDVCTSMSIQRDLPPEYEMRYQFTVWQWGKEAQNVIIQVTTHYTKFNPTYKHVHSKVTYSLRVHQFTVRQVGKGGENVIGKWGMEAKNVIIQVTTHYTKFNPVYKHDHSKVTYSLRVHQFTVRQVVKGENVIGIDQVVTHYPI